MKSCTKQVLTAEQFTWSDLGTFRVQLILSEMLKTRPESGWDEHFKRRHCLYRHLAFNKGNFTWQYLCRNAHGSSSCWARKCNMRNGGTVEMLLLERGNVNVYRYPGGFAVILFTREGSANKCVQYSEHISRGFINFLRQLFHHVSHTECFISQDFIPTITLFDSLMFVISNSYLIDHEEWVLRSNTWFPV